MKHSILLLFSCFFLPFYSIAQTFTGTGGPIPDDGNSVDYLINVSGLPTAIDTAFFGLEKVCINAIHTWDADLTITLIAPDGTTVTLVSGAGGDGDDFNATCFSDSGSSILSGTAPFSGQFKSMGQLGMVNNGQNPNGVWTLHILDTYPFADIGSLTDWSLTFSNDPASAFSLGSSNLPIIKINTNGQTINSGTKITANMGIIDNGPGNRNFTNGNLNGYSGYIGIEVRGHSSSGFAQQQYNVETRDSAGNNLDFPLLGMPAENDWVLYAPFNDKALMRNSLTYALSNQMGRYASRGVYCELLLNGEYKGVYTFFEKVKKDNNRVNLATLTTVDTAGIELTGGYLCSIDWPGHDGWNSNYPPDINNNGGQVFYQYIYPRDNQILPQQEAYIQSFVDSFETALLAVNYTDTLLGWRKYADEPSFIDFFLMNELSKNVDGYRLSTFFHKEKVTAGNKIKMGPLWDFNLAWHNADYCDNENIAGWAYLFTDYCSHDFPFWWRRLNTDTLFQNNIRCRWEELRTNILDTANIYHYVDSIATLLDESKERQFMTYPILGTYVWPNPAPLAQTYAEEIYNLKDWISRRIDFMDVNLTGECIQLPSALSFSNESGFELYPNPASSIINIIQPFEESCIYSIMDIRGIKIKEGRLEIGSKLLDISDLSDGVYVIKLSFEKQKPRAAKFIKSTY
jgi:subtilisin-like proprotein convertase family protein